MKKSVNLMRPPKVLIVDDVEDMIAFMEDEIKRLNLGILFERAYDAATAIKKFDGFKPAIVLLDIGLGLSSGFDVLRHIRRYDKEVKVIIVSNFTDSFFRLKCDDLGADHFIDKSKEFEKIPGIIKSIIEE